MKSKAILFFLLLSALIPLAYAADFGEDDQYLGQVVDDYENADNIAAMIDTINNETLDCMELNFSGSVPIIENFSLYTEVDIGSDRITFPNDTCVRHLSYRNEVTYLYEDYGVDAFYEYDVLFEVYVDFEQQYGRGIPFMLSNNIGNQRTHFDNVWNHTVLWFYRSTATPSQRYVALTWWHGGAPPLSGTDFTYNYPLDTWLYIRVRQNATHLSCWVYDDEAMTSLFTYLEVEVAPKNYRYVYSASGYNEGSTTYYIDYYNKDMVLFSSGGYATTGTYYVDDVLGGDPAIAILYNITLPSGTGATMEFSTDNLTWVDHNNQAGSDPLIAGYEALDLRDIYNGTTYRRVNMTSDGLDTPRMNQARLVTVTEGGGLFPGLAIGIALLIIGAIYALENRG